MEKNIQVVKDTKGRTIHPVTFSDAVYMNNGTRLEDNISFCTKRSLEVGSLDRLKTNNKVTLVGAINEVLSKNYVMEYGVRFVGSNPYGYRLSSAYGLSSQVSNGLKEVNNSFDNIYPWSEIKRCNINDEGIVVAYEGEPGFTLDGSNGNVMVEIPKFYQRYVKNELENYIEYWICEEQMDDYFLNPLFKNERDGEVDKIYIGAYEASSDNNKLYSRGGFQPSIDKSLQDLKDECNNNGEGWSLTTLLHRNIIEYLFVVEHATINSQSVFKGNSEGNLLKTGTSNNLGYHSGSIYDTNASSFKYRHIENLYGNVWEFNDNCIVDSNGNLELTIGNQVVRLDNMVNMDIESSFISKYSYDKEIPFINLPIEGEATNNTYYSDIFNCKNISEENVVLSGGRLGLHNEFIGLFCTQIMSVNARDMYTGARICFKK